VAVFVIFDATTFGVISSLFGGGPIASSRIVTARDVVRSTVGGTVTFVSIMLAAVSFLKTMVREGTLVTREQLIDKISQIAEGARSIRGQLLALPLTLPGPIDVSNEWGEKQVELSATLEKCRDFWTSYPEDSRSKRI